MKDVLRWLFVVLFAVPLFAGTLTYANRSADRARHLTLARDGERLLLRDDAGAIVAAAIATTIDRVAIAGAAGAHDDTLTVDLSQPFTLARGIDYDGGARGWDSLALRGGNVREQRITQLSPHDGIIELDGLVLRYTNLEPITDTAPAVTLMINGTAGADTVTVSDGAGNTTTVSSPSFESVTFANKTNVVFDGLGGGDTVTFANPNPATGLSSFIVRNVATVSQSAAINYPKFGVSATGAITLSNTGNEVDAIELATVNGNITFRESNGLVIGNVDPALTGISVATAGSIDVRVTNGDLALSDTDGTAVVRAGSASGNVLLRLEALGAQLTIGVDRDAALAPAGSIDINSAGQVILGNGGASFSNDVRAAGTVDINASGTITVTGASRVASDDFGTNSSAALNVRGFGGLTIDQTAQVGAGGTAGADANLLTGSGVMTLNGTNPAAGFSTSGDVHLTVSTLIIGPSSGLTAAGEVSIETFPVLGGLTLGPATDAPSQTDISDAEVDRIFAPRLHIIDFGSLPVTAPITFTTGTELYLTTQNGVEGQGTGSLSANTLTLEATNPATWTITPASVTFPGLAPIPYSGVSTLNALAGLSSNTFNVTPSATTTIHVKGGLPPPPATPGDRIDFDLTGVVAPVLVATPTPTGYTGSLTSANRAPVTFEEIESFVDAPVDLQITKSDGAVSAIAGETVTYTITVTNTAPVVVPGAIVSDTFPTDLSNISWTCTAGAGSICNSNGIGNLNESVTLGANSSVTFLVGATIAPSATGTLTNTATVTAPAGFPDTNPTNNSATDTTALTAEADLEITKGYTTGGYAPGSDLTYIITLRNNGPSDAQDVTITDVLPPQTTFRSLVAPAGYSCTTPAVGTNGTVTCTTATLAPSASPDTFLLTVRLNESLVPGQIFGNVATATSATADTSPNSATAVVTVSAFAAGIPTLSPSMLALLAAVLAFGALAAMKRV